VSMLGQNVCILQCACMHALKAFLCTKVVKDIMEEKKASIVYLFIILLLWSLRINCFRYIKDER